jgi:hypothetical protein
MRNRFDNALMIQQGACNIRGIARSLVEAADAAGEAGVQPSDDPAVRLIIHQLAFLANANEIDHSPTVYGALTAACEQAREAA